MKAATILTVAQAAESLGVTPRRVLALIATGRLAAVKFGNQWAIAPADLVSVRHRKPGWKKGRKRGVKK